MQESITYSTLREHLKDYLDKVCDDREPILVTRRNGGDVVLVCRDDYERMDETARIRHSPKNARRILKALENAKKGINVRERQLIEE